MISTKTENIPLFPAVFLLELFSLEKISFTNSGGLHTAFRVSENYPFRLRFRLSADVGDKLFVSFRLILHALPLFSYCYQITLPHLY